MADLVGVGAYPFEPGRKYNKRESLTFTKREMDFVSKSMKPAKPVVLGQSFAGKADGAGWPTKDQLRDWNCSLRQIRAEFISWYPWRQDRYEDYLANDQDYWPVTVGNACR